MKLDFLLIILYFGAFLTNANNSFISAFFPSFANRASVTETWVGFIFSAEPVGVFICTILLGRLMSKKGFKKPCMILGLLV